MNAEISVVYQDEIYLETSGHRDIHDITGDIQQIVSQSGTTAGTVHIFNIVSTGAVGTVEFEPGLKQDLPDILDKLMPPSREYGHEQTWNDGNGHSRLHATMLGPAFTVPIQNGELRLGTKQQIFHPECDIKSRQRTIVVTLYDE